MLSLDHMKLPIDGWKPFEQGPDYSQWFTEQGVLVTIGHIPEPGGGMPSDITRPDEIKAVFEEQNHFDNAALLNFKIGKIQGLECIYVLSKKWTYPDGNDLGKCFFSNIFFPLTEECFHLQSLAMEMNTTGIREATIDTMRINSGELDISTLEEGAPLTVSDPTEYAKFIKSQPMKIHVSDDEKYDAQFPTHPLTLVRMTMRTLEETVVISPELGKAGPFRV